MSAMESSYGTRPAYETGRALAFVAVYVLSLYLAIYVLGDPADDDSGAALVAAMLLHPVFGYVLARWWGFLLAPLSVVVALGAGTPVSDEGWELLPLWFGMLLSTPVLALLILAGFLARVAYDRWGRARPS